MNANLHKFLRSKVAATIGLSAILLLIAAFRSTSASDQERIRLEGAWIAQADNGLRALVTYAPSPSALTGNFRNQMIWPPELLAMVAVDAVTDEVGEEVVTGPNTSAYSAIWYGLVGGKVALIFVDESSLTWDNPNQKSIEHTVTVYPALADADNDGFPDPGSSPIPGGTFTTHSISKRVVH